ncbi:Lysylphosphatidylglycerol synthase TM region [Porphyromonadaceae bacterium NLAE-zl-C104]|uniref:lysylphosphatidylglycerol synthase domain-containing protein n=1 Tax=Proteiniphilum TaxID=294702 RepID=UPI0008E483A7|nr:MULTISPECIES: lysylphosphatidylglycerol synthase domain-containing protein [Proteiniphilum]MDY9918510.1 lysylphosphatidylglycerol synthase domain-containing protein [Proteiniphilum sp.]SFT03015.1 Lysylphosphatidylglycerol synthase TM region [Porphyromonadaceae bacterium NLAE-zl-C104]
MVKKTKIAQNLFFFLGGLALGIMVYKTGFDNILINIKQTGWWFVPIIGMWIIVYLVNTYSFYVIINDGSKEAREIGFLRLFKLVVSGFAVNYITPFGLMGGEPYKIIELKSTLGIQKATSTVLLSTMMHLVSHFIFWMISIPLLLFLVPVLSGLLEWLIFLVSIASLLFLFWAFRIYTRGGVERAVLIGGKLPFVGRRIRAFYRENQEKLSQMDGLIADLYKNRKGDFVLSLALEIFSRFFICVEIILIMQAIRWPVSFSQSILIESIQSLFSNLFFFMPMQMGAREGGFALVYRILAIPVALGIFTSLCKRIRELFWTLAGLLLIQVKRGK